MHKVSYTLGWLILAPIIVVISTIVCPFVVAIGCFQTAKASYPKKLCSAPKLPTKRRVQAFVPDCANIFGPN